jgi:hypothetical protein
VAETAVCTSGGDGSCTWQAGRQAQPCEGLEGLVTPTTGGGIAAHSTREQRGGGVGWGGGFFEERGEVAVQKSGGKDS